jgi:hypothetical protein
VHLVWAKTLKPITRIPRESCIHILSAFRNRMGAYRLRHHLTVSCTNPHPHSLMFHRSRKSLNPSCKFELSHAFVFRVRLYGATVCVGATLLSCRGWRWGWPVLTFILDVMPRKIPASAENWFPVFHFSDSAFLMKILTNNLKPSFITFGAAANR